MSFWSKLFCCQQTSTVTDCAAPAVPISVGAEHVFLNAPVKTKDDVLAFIAEKMAALGLVQGDYLPSLKMRESKVSTYLTNGVAIPHGVNETKEQVLKTGVVIVQVPNGVTWNDKGDVARLIVGIAANGQEHLGVLACLTRVVMTAAKAQQLTLTTEKSDIVEALNANEQRILEPADA